MQPSDANRALTTATTVWESGTVGTACRPLRATGELTPSCFRNGGQKVYLVPSLDLIVVSTGNAFFVDSRMNEVMARALLPALMRSSQN